MRTIVPLAGLLFVLLVPGLDSVEAGPTAGSSRGGVRWGANYFPNVLLTTHEGEEVRFFDDLIRDRVVVINFIYTTCPDVCPLETAKLTELQGILGDRVGQDVFMYSITIDPEIDTPEVLKAYAENYRVGPGWLFLTGDDDDITLLRKRLGLYIEEIQSEDSSDHNLSLVIGNQATGRWMKRSPFENPYYLARQVGSWLHNWKLAPDDKPDYAKAPELRNPGTGERLFSTRCAACHIVGGKEEVPPHMSGRLLGPDLLNVTQRRERSWLSRWLREPDKMLAEKDPLAMELFAKHNGVSMPNMALNRQDVEALLDYLEAESSRVEELVAKGLPVFPLQDSGGAGSSCCQKRGNPVLSEAATGDLEEKARREEPKREPSVVIAGFSAGLGCLFLVLSAVFLWHRPERTVRIRHRV